MKTTIYDVAKASGVSIATVSKVINNSGRIGEKTKKKVLETINELNYHPNMIATALTGKSTFSIGLLIPDLANPFFAELARSVEDRAHELGYNLVICSTDYNPAKEMKYVDLLKRKNVDGIIFASGFEQLDKIEELNESLPIAVVARDFPSSNVNTVSFDDYLGGFKATSHLIELGHEKIALIGRDVWSNRERKRGYEDAMHNNDLNYKFRFEYIEESNVEWGKYMAGKYMTSEDPPTAIVACNDLLASGAIQAVKEYGLSVPDDVSIVGFDNTIIATLTDPLLTTIAQPIKSMGKHVMDLMSNEIENNVTDKSRITLIPKLVTRGSTKQVNKRIVQS
ncbi:LacI family DNA-binding transcriptional regulator [Alteribacillus sp. YIM 98480]|uniref:LacI family DNA-binding transcriptional regulator n=1 Tax=Alteribacillus sp. YIM 98480 TaxID=2606599 RepID=UPI00131D2766|nr:LacI family DNA-binding transcriptional regulator [Alteribacillus sp. YIM 98480]